jgi:hypothetical protein
MCSFRQQSTRVETERERRIHIDRPSGQVKLNESQGRWVPAERTLDRDVTSRQWNATSDEEVLAAEGVGGSTGARRLCDGWHCGARASMDKHIDLSGTLLLR